MKHQEFSRKDHLHIDVHDISCGSKLRLQRDRCDPLSLKEVKILKGRSTCWRILTLVPQMSNPRVKKLHSMCSRTMKLVIKMVIKGRSPTMRHVSRTHRVAFDWLFDRINFGSQNRNQIHRHQKPTRRNTDQRKFHTWWVKSLVVIVRYQSFQFYSALTHGRNDLKRFRRRTSHSKIETNDESYCQDAVVRVVINFSEPGRNITEI